VTQFLTQAANLAQLAAIARCAAAESEVVFDYLELAAFSPDHAAEEIRRMRTERAATAEPWQSGFDPVRLHAQLTAVGLALVEDLDPAELERRYCSERSDGLHAIAHAHVARARVA
jgi:O-methyltransferase involved in polyketide biosynthesis